MKIRTKWPKNRRPTTPPTPSVRTAPANRNVKFLKKNEKKWRKVVQCGEIVVSLTT